MYCIYLARLVNTLSGGPFLINHLFLQAFYSASSCLAILIISESFFSRLRTFSK